MARKTKSRNDILRYTLEDWVYILLDNHFPGKIPEDAPERVEYAFAQMAGREKQVQMFKMHFEGKKTYQEIAQRYRISNAMAYRYVHWVEQKIKEDQETRYLLNHPVSEGRIYMEKKQSIFRNDIWTYEVVDLLKNDQTPFKAICGDIRYKYPRLETYFGIDFTVSDIVCASKEDFHKIKGFGEKTQMMVTVAVWQHYNKKVKEGMAAAGEPHRAE